METLGLDSRPKPEGRLKTLFWPTIQYDADIRDLSAQGFWVCVLLALITLGYAALQGSIAAGAVIAAFYLFGGIGVRCRSRFAAIAVLCVYSLNFVLGIRDGKQGIGVIPIVILAILTSNARAIWLAARWPGESPDIASSELPARGLLDWMVDRMPPRVWPATRWLFYLLTAIEALFLLIVAFHPTLRS